MPYRLAKAFERQAKTVIHRFLHNIYPFATLSSSSFNNFVWMASLLILGMYVVIGAGPIWTPACFLLLRGTRLERIRNHLERRLGRCLVAGIGTIAIIYAIDSTLSLLAIPGRVLSVLFSALFWVMLVLGYAAIALWITSKARKGSATLMSVVVGAVLITILQIIPVVGVLFIVWFVLLALGSVVVSVSAKNQTTPRTATSADEPRLNHILEQKPD